MPVVSRIVFLSSRCVVITSGPVMVSLPPIGVTANSPQCITILSPSDPMLAHALQRQVVFITIVCSDSANEQ